MAKSVTLSSLLEKVRAECRRIYHENNDVLVSTLATRLNIAIKPLREENLSLRQQLVELKEEVRELKTNQVPRRSQDVEELKQQYKELNANFERIWRILLNQYPDIENEFKIAAASTQRLATILNQFRQLKPNSPEGYHLADVTSTMNKLSGMLETFNRQLPADELGIGSGIPKRSRELP